MFLLIISWTSDNISKALRSLCFGFIWRLFDFPSLFLSACLSQQYQCWWPHREKSASCKNVIFFNNLLLKKTATILHVKLKKSTCSYWKKKEKRCIFHMCKQFITTCICIRYFTATPSGRSNDHSCDGQIWNMLAWMDLSDTPRCSFRRQLFMPHVNPNVDFDLFNIPNSGLQMWRPPGCSK